MHKSVISVLTSILFSAAVFGQCCMPVSAYSSDEYVSRLTEPEKSTDSSDYRYYYSSENPYVSYGYGMPNCTAYAWGRAFEITGSRPQLSTGMAGRWYTANIKSGSYGYGCVPALGAIACFDLYNNEDGHVAVVEECTDDRSTVTVSESQYGSVNFTTYTYSSDSSDHMLRYRFLGYIYTDDTSGKFYGDAFRLISSGTGKYITYEGNMTASLSEKSEKTALQNFRFEPLENDCYKIWSVSEDVLLRHSENFLSISSDDNSSDTMWRIYESENGSYTISPADNSSYALAVSDGSLTLSGSLSDISSEWNIERATGITPLNISDRTFVYDNDIYDSENIFTDEITIQDAPSPEINPAPVITEEDTVNESVPESESAGYLSVDWSNMKTDYIINEIPDISGIVLSVNEKKISKIDISKLEINYDLSSVGRTIVEVKYDGLTAYYPVTVQNDPEKEQLIFAIADYILSGNTYAEPSYDLNHDNVVDSADIIAVYY